MKNRIQDSKHGSSSGFVFLVFKCFRRPVNIVPYFMLILNFSIGVLFLYLATHDDAMTSTDFYMTTKGCGSGTKISKDKGETDFSRIPQFKKSMSVQSRIQEDFDVKNYKFDIRLETDEELINGRIKINVETIAATLDSMVLDFLDTMSVDSVKMLGEKLSFVHKKDHIRFRLNRTYNFGEKAEFSVFYHGHPVMNSSWGGFTFGTHAGVPVVSSISWPDNSKAWFPCKDELTDKATGEMNLTVRDDLYGVSNGKLLDVIDNKNGTKTFKWKTDYVMTPYCFMIAVSNYLEFSNVYHSVYSPDSMKINYYVYPEDEVKAKKDFTDLPVMIECFSQVLGEYPYLDEKYGMVEVPLGGAMEHQTITSMGSILITGNGMYRYTYSHELAHMWFGDLVTPATMKDLWLSEGFATWCEALFASCEGGFDAYRDYMIRLDEGSFQGPIYDPIELLSSTVYNKGAWALHMIRWILGDSIFFPMLRDYLEDAKFRFANVTTEQFQDFCEQAYGKNLDWFFSEWIYGEGRPFYLLDWHLDDKVKDKSGYKIKVEIEQVQDQYLLYKMPMELEISMVDGKDTTFSVWDSLQYQEYTFNVEDVPKSVHLDPQSWILKKMIKPLEILTDTLPHGFEGTFYFIKLKAQGGIPQYKWQLVSGSLAQGLTFDSLNAIIYGTPSEQGNFPLTIKVKDSFKNPHTVKKNYNIKILPMDAGDTEDLPGYFRFDLKQNFPNPFNPETCLYFQVPGKTEEEKSVYLNIYDISGKLIKSLIDKKLPAGIHFVLWNGKNQQNKESVSGIYFAVLKIQDNQKTIKLVLLK